MNPRVSRLNCYTSPRMVACFPDQYNVFAVFIGLYCNSASVKDRCTNFVIFRMALPLH